MRKSEEFQMAITYPGDAGDHRTHGGSTSFLIDGFRQIGAKAIGLDTRPGWEDSWRRYGWNALEVISGRGRGGYQYSATRLERTWSKLGLEDVDALISYFQLYPRSIFEKKSLIKSFYIDMTLRQLFEFYMKGKLSEYHQHRAIEEEQRQYRLCDAVICRCRWAADDVIEMYGIDPHKVHVVLGGANLPENVVSREVTWSPSRGHLKLVFVGKDPVRKGLLRLLDAVNTSEILKSSVELIVIGCNEEDLPLKYHGMPWVSWRGHVRKSPNDASVYADLVGSCDIGVLLSTAEATGASLLEYQVLGLGVIAPDVGGSPELLIPGAGHIVSPFASPTDIADILLRLVNNREQVDAMKRASIAGRGNATWRRAGAEIKKILVSSQKNVCGTVNE